MERVIREHQRASIDAYRFLYPGHWKEACAAPSQNTLLSHRTLRTLTFSVGTPCLARESKRTVASAAL